MRSNGLQAPRVYVALVHHPVVNKNGDTIAAAVTNLDLHDIARVARTFDVRGFYVATPLEDQVVLVQRIIDHWVTGVGADYNPDRRDALDLIRIQPDLAAVIADITAAEQRQPTTVVTSAKMPASDLSVARLKKKIAAGQPVVLIFGTAWGLAPEVIETADHRLAPIRAAGDYNHLAVRSAVAIILDRLMGRCENN